MIRARQKLPKAKVDRLQSAPNYIASLTPLWEEQKDARKSSDADLGWERSPKLRASDLIEELIRCYLLTERRAYLDAALGLEADGFITSDPKKRRFVAFKSREQRTLDAARRKMVSAMVRDKHSLRFACAYVAARSGASGANLEAAAKSLELDFRSSAKRSATK